jgi:CBS domain-containing protein
MTGQGKDPAMTVGDVCRPTVVTAYADETVTEAARRMRDRHVGDVVVVDAQKRPIGILTDRDIVVSAVAQSADRLEGLRVGDIMTRDLVVARRHELLDGALAEMRARGVRRLPVLTADGRLDGILAFDDIVAVMSGELKDLVGLVALEQKHEREVRK